MLEWENFFNLYFSKLLEASDYDVDLQLISYQHSPLSPSIVITLRNCLFQYWKVKMVFNFGHGIPKKFWLKFRNCYPLLKRTKILIVAKRFALSLLDSDMSASQYPILSGSQSFITYLRIQISKNVNCRLHTRPKSICRHELSHL